MIYSCAQSSITSDSRTKETPLLSEIHLCSHKTKLFSDLYSSNERYVSISQRTEIVAGHSGFLRSRNRVSSSRFIIDLMWNEQSKCLNIKFSWLTVRNGIKLRSCFDWYAMVPRLLICSFSDCQAWEFSIVLRIITEVNGELQWHRNFLMYWFVGRSNWRNKFLGKHTSPHFAVAQVLTEHLLAFIDPHHPWWDVTKWHLNDLWREAANWNLFWLCNFIHCDLRRFWWWNWALTSWYDLSLMFGALVGWTAVESHPLS